MEEINYDELDSGIRETVKILQGAGFDTCDSGDGVSKSPEEYEDGTALPFAHVVTLIEPEAMVSEAHRMAMVLGSHWEIEAAYNPHLCLATLMARHRDESPHVQ